MKNQEQFPLKIRNRLFSEDDLVVIRSIIESKPKASRQDIAREVCLSLSWYQPNGELKMMGCKAAMLILHSKGLIALPPPKTVPIHLSQKQKPIPHTIDGDPKSPIIKKAKELLPITLEPVSKGKESNLWNEFMDRYHYLAYSVQKGAKPTLSHQLFSRIRGSDQFRISCLGYSSPR